MLQGVRVVDQSLKVSSHHSLNFLNVSMTFDLLFLPKRQFSDKKFNVLRWSFDRKLISPNMSNVQKYLFDLGISQIVTVLGGKIWISFSNHKISLCSKSPYFDGVTLNNFGCVSFSHWEKRGCSGLSL